MIRRRRTSRCRTMWGRWRTTRWHRGCGLIRQHFLEVCDDETRANTEWAFDKFADLGCEADEVGLPASFDTCYSALTGW